MALKMRLGDRLVENGLISSQQLEKALAKHAITGEKLGQTLVAMGFLQPDDLMKTLAADAGIPYVLLTDVEPEHSAIAIVPENIARRLFWFGPIAFIIRHDAVGRVGELD